MIASLLLASEGLLDRQFFYHTNPSDEWVIDQVFRQHQYAFDQWPSTSAIFALIERRRAENKKPLIIDAGANIGASAVYFASKIPSARIVAIEPAADNFDLLQRNTSDLDVEPPLPRRWIGRLSEAERWGAAATAHGAHARRGREDLAPQFPPCHCWRMIRFRSTAECVLARLARVLGSPLLAVALLVAGLSDARAQNINEPEVEKGQVKLESFHVFQSGFNNGAAGNTREAHNPSYYRGITDFWQIKASLALERPDREGYDATAAVLENTFAILNAKKTGGLGLAWFTGIAVAVSEQETNALTYGPIVRLGAGPTSLILNTFLESSFGQNHEGTAFLYGWQLKHEARKGFWLGVEGFGRYPDIGSGGPQEQRIGPLVTFEFETADKRTLTFETGVLFGLNETTPDTTVKAQVTLTFDGG